MKYIDVTDMGNYATDTKYEYNEEGYKEKYNIMEDCYLVRTTDIFPMDKVIQTPKNANAYGFAHSNIFNNYLSTKIKEKYPNYSNSESEKFLKELAEYNVYFEILRSTIHFSINGLVGSHAYGDFSNRPFVIIEPLKHHLDDLSLMALTAADTYFCDDMLLSDDCILLIDERYFSVHKDDPEFMAQISNYNVRIFKGEASLAVKKTLEDLNKYQFSVSSNGYVNGTSDSKEAGKMYRYLLSYADEEGFSTTPHFNSEINNEDNWAQKERGETIEREHLDYVLDKSNTDEKLREKFNYALSLNGYYNEEKEKLLFAACDELISKIGLDELKHLTNEFNQECIMKYQNSAKSK